MEQETPGRGRSSPVWGPFEHPRASFLALDSIVDFVLLSLNTQIARFDFDLGLNEVLMDFPILL